MKDRSAEFELAVTSALDQYTAAADEYSKLCYKEMKLQAERPLAKDAAIRQAMAPTEQEPKGLSYTNAERTAEADVAYAAFLRELRDTVRLKELAHAKMEAALRQADLALALVRVKSAERLQEVV